MIANQYLITPTANSSVDDFQRFIWSFNINPEGWKVQGMNPIESLRDFMRERWIDFIPENNSPPILEEHSSVIIVQFIEKGAIYELYEDRQVLNATRMNVSRRLVLKLNGVGTAIRRRESSVDAALRCFKRRIHGRFGKELFKGVPILVGKGVQQLHPITSERWSPIRVQLHRHLFLFTLDEKSFDEEGYVEHEPDREIFFSWKRKA